MAAIADKKLSALMVQFTMKYHPLITKEIARKSNAGGRKLKLTISLQYQNCIKITGLSEVESFTMWFNDVVKENPTFVPELQEPKDNKPYDYCSLTPFLISNAHFAEQKNKKKCKINSRNFTYDGLTFSSSFLLLEVVKDEM